MSSVSSNTNMLVIGKLLDDNRPVVEGGKYKKALELKKKIMTEKEFELFCRQKFENPDFILGRKKKKDTTQGAYDYYAGEGEINNDLDGIDDIS